MRCTSCGSPLANRVKFCGQCGQPLSADEKFRNDQRRRRRWWWFIAGMFLFNAFLTVLPEVFPRYNALLEKMLPELVTVAVLAAFFISAMIYVVKETIGESPTFGLRRRRRPKK